MTSENENSSDTSAEGVQGDGHKKNKELELTRESENSKDMDEGAQQDGRKTNEELELTKENEKSCDSMDEGTQEQKGNQCISLFFSGENL